MCCIMINVTVATDHNPGWPEEANEVEPSVKSLCTAGAVFGSESCY